MAKGRLKALRKKSSSAIGLLTLMCGFLMMWSSARGINQYSGTQSRLYQEAIEIDPLLPDSKMNGEVVVAAGKLSSAEQLEDEFIKPGPYLILARRVEMFQWQESKSPLAEAVEYSLNWHQGQIDFFSFRQPTGHENPLLRYQPFVRNVGSAVFGGFDAEMILRSVQHLIPLTLTPEMLKDPSLTIENNKLVIRRQGVVGEGANLGDTRIWYEVLPQGDYTVLARQVDERNLLGASPSNGMVIRQGIASIDQLFAEERADSQKTSDGLLYAGGVIFAVGLFSLLAPIANRIDLRPRLPLSGVVALMAICIVAAAVAVVVFFVMARLG